MAATIQIIGTITKSTGGPLAGVTVKLKDADDGDAVVDTDVTDASGNYSVSHTEPSPDFHGYYADPESIPPHWGDPGTGPQHELDDDSLPPFDDDFVSPFTNNNPTCGTMSDREFEEDSGSHTGDFTMSDSDGDVLTPSKVSGASWGTVSKVGASTGRWTWDTDGVSPGEYTFEYKVTDEFGATSTTRSLVVTITASNTAPVLTNPGNKSYANNSGNHTFQLAATDADDDPLTFSKQSGPTWVTVSIAGLVTVKANDATRGVHNVTFKVSDGQGGTDTESITITITNNAPVLTNPGNQQYSTDSGSKQLQLSATDADGDPKTFSKTAGAAWGTVTSAGLITFAIDGVVAGDYPFTFQVSDGQGGTDSESFTVTLVAPVPAPFFQMVS